MSQEQQRGGPIIRAVGPTGFLVGEDRFRAVLLMPRNVLAWSPPPLAELGVEALAAILDPVPEFVLLGTGDTLARPPKALVAALETRNIGIEPMDSRAAARAWTVLRAEDRQVVAAFYPLG